MSKNNRRSQNSSLIWWGIACLLNATQMGWGRGYIILFMALTWDGCLPIKTSIVVICGPLCVVCVRVVIFRHCSKLHFGMKFYGALCHLGIGTSLGLGMMCFWLIDIVIICEINKTWCYYKWMLLLQRMLRSRSLFNHAIIWVGKSCNHTTMDPMNNCFCTQSLGGMVCEFM